MNNFRYDKLNLMIHLQNQKSHYKRIIQARKNIDFKSMQQNTIGCVGPNQKLKLKQNRQRKQNNFKLINKINEINNKYGLLESMQIQSRKKNKSVKNYHSISNKHTQTVINRDNLKIAQRLIEAKPQVGSAEQWKKQFKQFKKAERRIQKYDKDKNYDPQIYLRDTLSSLSRLNRKQAKRFSSLSRNYTHFSQNEDNVKKSEVNQSQHQEGMLDEVKEKKFKKRRYMKTSENKRSRHQDLKLSQNQSKILKFEINQIILNDDYNYTIQKQDKTETSRT